MFEVDVSSSSRWRECSSNYSLHHHARCLGGWENLGGEVEGMGEWIWG